MSQDVLLQVDAVLDQLTPEEQWLVMERLLQRLKPAIQSQKQHQDLYGIWRDAFPPDLDLDRELADIRHQWEEEWQDL